MPASRANDSPLSGESVTTVQVVEGSSRVDGLPVISGINRSPAAGLGPEDCQTGSVVRSSHRPLDSGT